MAVSLTLAASWPPNLQLSRAKNKMWCQETACHGATIDATNGATNRHTSCPRYTEISFGQYLGCQRNCTEA